MDDTSPAEVSDTTARPVLRRGIVFTAAAIGSMVGLLLAVLIETQPVVRWALVPPAVASAGAMIGFVLAVRRLRREVTAQRSMQGGAPRPHSLPTSRRVEDLALGPNPWRADAREDDAATRAEMLPPDPVFLTPLGRDSEEPRSGSLVHLLSHDGLRYLRPSEHELERARRAVAKIVADLAPQPGAFDAVCERLLAAGDAMAQRLAALDRPTPDHEKHLGVDLVARLAETRITEAGLEILTWMRWVRATLHAEGGAGAAAFYDPVAVAMAARYGGTSEQWHAVIAEPIVDLELGGVVEKIALGIKSGSRPYSVLPDPDAVDRILEAPQWM